MFAYVSMFQGIVFGLLTVLGLYILYKLVPAAIAFFKGKLFGTKQ